MNSIKQTYSDSKQIPTSELATIKEQMKNMIRPKSVPELYQYIANRVERRMPSSEKTGIFMKGFYTYFEETVLAQLEKKENHAGFQNAERIKARKFRDQLAEARKRFATDVNPDLVKKKNYLLTKISKLGQMIYKYHAKKESDKKKLQELKKKYDKANYDYEMFMIKMREKVPVFAYLEYPTAISVQDLQRNILKKEELIVQYFISPINVYVFVISQEDFQVIKLEVSEKEINKIVNRYLLSAKFNNSTSLVKYGKELYQKIFKPLKKAIKAKTSLIIVPDGKLALVPFEALVTDDRTPDKPVFLLEKYPIKYIQNSAILEMVRTPYSRRGKNKTSETSEPTKTNRFIGFGDPVYDYKRFEKGKGTNRKLLPGSEKVAVSRSLNLERYSRGGGILSRLEASGEEVEAIAQLFEKKTQYPPVVYLREKAAEENAKAPNLKEFDYIHFSCHGVLGNRFQGLVLSQIPGAVEDGYLTLFEIMTCAYNAKLVVLSACQTGKEAGGDGVTGLTRAVMYAGAPAVVASLWNVTDIATKELMIKFYKNILEKGLSKENALRTAKREMIKEGKYSSPYFWSAFVMYGE